MNKSDKEEFESRVCFVSPGVLRTKADCSIVDNRLAEILRSYHYREERDISRCCIHRSNESLLMIMLIIVTGKYVYPPHKHDWKDESYSILNGQCAYMEYDARVEVKLCKHLTQGDIYMNESRTFHALVPYTDELMFVEHTMGPFTDMPIQYLSDESA